MQNITVMECFKGSWRDGVSILLKSPLISIAVFAILYLTTIWVMPASVPASTAAIGAHTSTSHALTTLLAMVLRYTAGAFFVVHCTRASFFHNDHARGVPLPTKPSMSMLYAFWRYYRLIVGITVLLLVGGLGVAVLLAAVIGIMGGKATLILLSSNIKAMLFVCVTLLTCAVVYTGARLSILFADRALGSKVSWKAAWQATRGRFWIIFGIRFLTVLPMIGIWCVGAVVLVVFKHVETERANLLFSGAVISLGTMLYLAVSASCGAWVYCRLARHTDATMR